MSKAVKSCQKLSETVKSSQKLSKRIKTLKNLIFVKNVNKDLIVHEKLVVNSSYFCMLLQSILYFHIWHCEGHLTLERLLLCVKLLCFERLHRKQTLVDFEYNTQFFFPVINFFSPFSSHLLIKFLNVFSVAWIPCFLDKLFTLLMRPFSRHNFFSW